MFFLLTQNFVSFSFGTAFICILLKQPWILVYKEGVKNAHGVRSLGRDVNHGSVRTDKGEPSPTKSDGYFEFYK